MKLVALTSLALRPIGAFAQSMASMIVAKSIFAGMSADTNTLPLSGGDSKHPHPMGSKQREATIAAMSGEAEIHSHDDGKVTGYDGKITGVAFAG